MFFAALSVYSFPVIAQQASTPAKKAIESPARYAEASPNKLIALEPTRGTAVFEDGKGQLHVVTQGQKLAGTSERLVRVFSDHVELLKENAAQATVLFVHLNERVSVKRAELETAVAGKGMQKKQEISSSRLTDDVAGQPGRGGQAPQDNNPAK